VILHAHTYGDGPPIGCVHGVTGHGERFEMLSEKLPGHRLVAFDLRGHGRSGHEPPWNLETHVADLAESAAAHGITTRAPWIGFSFGGRLVAELALSHPELVASLALLDPALQLPADFALEAAGDELSEQTFATIEDAVDARLDAGTLFSTPRGYVEQDMRQHLERTPDGRLRARYSRPAAIAAWGEMARPAPPPAPVPTLLVLGTKSQVPNDASRYPDATVETLDAGHTVLWDAFEETAAAVARLVA
jgi:lipase